MGQFSESLQISREFLPDLPTTPLGGMNMSKHLVQCTLVGASVHGFIDLPLYRLPF